MRGATNESINSNLKYRFMFLQCNFCAKVMTSENSADILNYRKSRTCASVLSILRKYPPEYILIRMLLNAFEFKIGSRLTVTLKVADFY